MSANHEHSNTLTGEQRHATRRDVHSSDVELGILQLIAVSAPGQVSCIQDTSCDRA